MVISGVWLPFGVWEGRVSHCDAKAGTAVLVLNETVVTRFQGIQEGTPLAGLVRLVGRIVIVEQYGRDEGRRFTVRPVTPYQEKIADMCSCSFSRAVVIEARMRDITGTLDHLTATAFAVLARESYRALTIGIPSSDDSSEKQHG